MISKASAGLNTSRVIIRVAPAAVPANRKNNPDNQYRELKLRIASEEKISVMLITFAMRLELDRQTPLGRPVVPEEHTITARRESVSLKCSGL